MNREQMCGLLGDFVQLSTLVQHLVYRGRMPSISSGHGALIRE